MTTFTMHYTLRSHETHPFTAVIMADDGTFIGSEFQYRDENQMRCAGMGFLLGWEARTPYGCKRVHQVSMDLKEVEQLPTDWERNKLAFG